MRVFTLHFGPIGLEYDADYGIDRRSGWSAVYDGSVLYELGSFWRAVAALAREAMRKRGA